jgi:hypothetical protein
MEKNDNRMAHPPAEICREIRLNGVLMEKNGAGMIYPPAEILPAVI